MTKTAPAARTKAGKAPRASWLAAPVIWTGGEDVVTVALDLGVYVGNPALGRVVVGYTELMGGVGVADEESVRVADSDAGLVGTPEELGIGIVEIGASLVRDSTPYNAAQSVRLKLLGQHHVPSALSVQ